MTDNPWPGLKSREYKILERGGINSADHFIELIEQYGLIKGQDGTYYFAETDDLFLRGAGKKSWKSYIKMLDDAGFNWRAHLGRMLRSGRQVKFYKFRPPNTKAEKHREITAAIKRLIVLLEEYMSEFEGEG